MGQITSYFGATAEQSITDNDNSHNTHICKRQECEDGINMILEYFERKIENAKFNDIYNVSSKVYLPQPVKHIIVTYCKIIPKLTKFTTEHKSQYNLLFKAVLIGNDFK